MKLLITTQAVDENDPVLGFMCRWLTEFATKFERIEVICLFEGVHHLPSNISVYSLGKERAGMIYHTSVFRRFQYAVRFKMLVWRLRRDYDAVFVHMNPEYVILGGIAWRVWGKRVGFWYNHPHAGIRLRVAVFLSHMIFYTSPYAATAGYKKARQMPVGINTEIFSPQSVSRNRLALYMQGRITPSKRVHILLEALHLLRKDVLATLTVVGPEDPVYGKKLRVQFADLIASGAVTFAGSHPNEETPRLYSAHGVAINLAPAGHFDKSAFEAMSCETPVVVSSHAFSGIVPDEWIVPENDPTALASALLKMVELSENEYRALGEAERTAVIQEHSLPALTKALVQELSPSYHSEA